MGTSIDINEARMHGIASAGIYTFDAQGRMTNKLAAVESAPTGVTTEVMGRVVTVTVDATAPACRVGYLNANGEYEVIDATVNADGSYNFAADKEATEIVIVVAGDTDGNGQVESTDVTALQQSILGKPESAADTAAEKLAGDLNGDGKLSIADLVLLNAASKDKIDIKW